MGSQRLEPGSRKWMVAVIAQWIDAWIGDPDRKRTTVANDAAALLLAHPDKVTVEEILKVLGTMDKLRAKGTLHSPTGYFYVALQNIQGRHGLLETRMEAEELREITDPIGQCDFE